MTAVYAMPEITSSSNATDYHIAIVMIIPSRDPELTLLGSACQQIRWELLHISQAEIGNKSNSQHEGKKSLV